MCEEILILLDLKKNFIPSLFTQKPHIVLCCLSQFTRSFCVNEMNRSTSWLKLYECRGIQKFAGRKYCRKKRQAGRTCWKNTFSSCDNIWVYAWVSVVSLLESNAMYLFAVFIQYLFTLLLFYCIFNISLLKM